MSRTERLRRAYLPKLDEIEVINIDVVKGDKGDKGDKKKSLKLPRIISTTREEDVFSKTDKAPHTEIAVERLNETRLASAAMFEKKDNKNKDSPSAETYSHENIVIFPKIKSKGKSKQVSMPMNSRDSLKFPPISKGGNKTRKSKRSKKTRKHKRRSTKSHKKRH